MKVQNVGYNKLEEDSDLCAAFRAEVRDAVAAEADPGFPPERVHLKLRPGSVIVDAEITSLTPGTATAIKNRLNGSASLSTRVASSVKAIQGIDSVSTGDVFVTDIVAGIKSPPGRDGLTEVEHEVEEEVKDALSNLSSVPQPALAAAAASSFLCLAICLIGCFLACRPKHEAGKGYLLAPDEDLENVHSPPETPKQEEPKQVEQQESSVPLLAPEVAPQPEQPAALEPVVDPTPAVPADEKKEEEKETPQPKEKGKKKRAGAKPGAKRAAAKKDAEKKVAETPRDENTEPQAATPDKAASPAPSGQTTSRSKNSGDKRADAAYASYVRLAEDMGFPESQASVALAEAGGNSATALDKLLAQP
jgi:hypothetical protein